MYKIKFLLFIMFTACSLFTCSINAQQLLNNPNLKKVDSNGIPEQWGFYWWGAKREFKTFPTPKTPDGFFLSQKGFVNGGLRFKQFVKLAKKEKYQAEVTLKVTGKPKILVRFIMGKYECNRAIKPSSSGEWQTIKVELIAPQSGVGKFTIDMYKDGKLWLKKITLVKKKTKGINKKTTAQPSTLKMNSLFSRAGNLIYNGGFEVGGYGFCPFSKIDSYISDSEKAPQGNYSLKIPIDTKNFYRKDYVGSQYFQIKKAGRYSFSFCAKASTNMVVTGTLENAVTKSRNSISVLTMPDKEWQCFSGYNHLPVGIYRIKISTDSKKAGAHYCIDNIEVLPVEKISSSQENSNLTVGVKIKKADRLFNPGESIVCDIYAYSASKLPKAELLIKVEDYYGKIKFSQTIKPMFSSSGHFKTTVPLDFKSLGMFRVNIFHDKKVIAEDCFGVIRDVSNNRDVYFGAHPTVWGEGACYQSAKKLGFGSIRAHDMLEISNWSAVEPQRGRFRWFDGVVDYLKANNFKSTVGMLNRVPPWAAKNGDQLIKEIPQQAIDSLYKAALNFRQMSIGGYPTKAYIPYYRKFHKQRSMPPAKIADWQNYVEKTVSHYKDNVSVWEVWNEPYHQHLISNNRPKDYMRLLKSAYKTIKSVSKDDLVIGGCVNPYLPDFTRDIIAKGALQYMDVLSYHKYYSADDGIQSVKSGIDSIRYFIPKSKRELPIWNTEFGINNASFSKVFISAKEARRGSVKKQDYRGAVEALVRVNVVMKSERIERAYYYWLAYIDDFVDDYNGTSMTGRLGGARPLAIGQAVCSFFLAHSKFVKRLELSKCVSAFVFKKKESNVAVLWNRVGWTGTSTILPTDNRIAFFNLMGNKLKNTSVVLKGSEPVFATTKMPSNKFIKKLTTLNIKLEGSFLKDIPPSTPAFNRFLARGNFSWKHISLSSLVNISTIDDIAHDKKGGWTDQGNMNDLRGIKAGTIKFEHIPFKILPPNSGKHNIIGLHFSRIKRKAPTSVTIPINDTCRAIYFLQGAAWARKAVLGKITLLYDDNRSVSFPINGNTNIGDWCKAPAKAMPSALTAPIKTGVDFNITRYLYVYGELNPHPKKQIKSITYQSNEQSFLALLGITLLK